MTRRAATLAATLAAAAPGSTVRCPLGRRCTCDGYHVAPVTATRGGWAGAEGRRGHWKGVMSPY